MLSQTRGHICKRCGAAFARKDTLKRHAQRKTPCVQTVDRPGGAQGHACGDCGRTFGRKSNLVRHRRQHCVARRTREARAAGGRERELEAEVERLKREQKQTLKRLEALEGAKGARGGGSGAHVNHGTVVNGDVKVEQKIVLNVWGGESFEHITPDRTREIVRALRRELGGEDAEVKAVARAVAGAMAREIWVENPANRVAYLPNVKGSRARVRTARGWEERASRDVEEAMHKTTVWVTGLKQPMEDERDLKLMTPVLEELGEAPVARAGMRAALISMRPGKGGERGLAGASRGLGEVAGGASGGQGPAKNPAKACGGESGTPAYDRGIVSSEDGTISGGAGAGEAGGQ